MRSGVSSVLVYGNLSHFNTLLVEAVIAILGLVVVLGELHRPFVVPVWRFRSRRGPLDGWDHQMLGAQDVDKSDVDFWALHPGGHRIVEVSPTRATRWCCICNL